MKLLTNGMYRVTPSMREQVMQHIGPAGPRRYTQEVADYDVPGAQADENDGLWETSFVAGDLISVVAGRVGGGPLEIAVRDEEGNPVALSASPNGLCYAGAKVPRSGVYSFQVRHVPLAYLTGDASQQAASETERPAPFTLCCTRQIPRHTPAHLASPRKPADQRDAPSHLQRIVAHLARRVGAEPRRGSARAGYA